MKKVICMVCSFFLIFLNGCNNILRNDFDDTFDIANVTNSIYDINNKVIGQIEHFGRMQLTDNSIIYTKIPNAPVKKITKIDYYRYVIETGENIKIGTVKEFVGCADYDAVIVNNHLYSFITTGDFVDIDKRVLKLYDIDLNSNKMSVLSTQKGGFPYSFMTVAGNKILMGKSVPYGNCYVEEYNIDTKETSIILNFDYNYETEVGDGLRQITSDENTISLLRINSESKDDACLYLDIYDHEMNFLRTVDLATICSDTEGSDEVNQRCQAVSSFFVLNNYIYYENFSLTRFLGKIEGDSIKSIMKTNMYLKMASELVKNQDASVFFQAYGTVDDTHEGGNDLYLFDTVSGIIKKAEFYADYEGYYFVNATMDTNDNLLITMVCEDPEPAEKLPPRLYYINLSDLEFETLGTN